MPRETKKIIIAMFIVAACCNTGHAQGKNPCDELKLFRFSVINTLRSEGNKVYIIMDKDGAAKDDFITIRKALGGTNGFLPRELKLKITTYNYVSQSVKEAKDTCSFKFFLYKIIIDTNGSAFLNQNKKLYSNNQGRYLTFEAPTIAYASFPENGKEIWLLVYDEWANCRSEEPIQKVINCILGG